MGPQSVRRRWAPVVAAGAAALALSVAATGTSFALASPVGAPPPSRVVHFPLPAITGISAGAASSHGFQLGLSASRQTPLRREANGRGATSYLTISLKNSATSADYGVRAAVAPDGSIAASLGLLGRLDLRFVPRQVTERPLGHRCDGSEKVERGVLRGTFAFHGENGYTDLAATVLPATLTTSPELLCTFRFPRPSATTKSHESIRFGGNSSRGRNRLVDFTAYEHPGLGTATLTATSSERRGPVSITRYAKAVVPARAAPFDQTAGTASVAASAPFRGSAHFHTFPGKEAGTWLGPLSVDFAGRSGVRLAGHRYKGSLLSSDECGPDNPGFNCIGLRVSSPIGLGPIRRPK